MNFVPEDLMVGCWKIILVGVHSNLTQMRKAHPV